MTAQTASYDVVRHVQPSMGGTLQIAISVEPERREEAALAAQRACSRVERWAARLTRFSPDSDLSALNRADAVRLEVRPTLAATLRWAIDARARSSGVVDATLLDARLAAESGAEPPAAGIGAWQVEARGRSAVVARSSGVSFDLDGVAKGWIADRAAGLLRSWPGVAVDADGDIAFHADAGVEWLIELDDPRHPESDESLATLRLTGGEAWSRRYGVATSGTSIHRWQHDGRQTHHLIDPRTGRPAETDVVQSTVVAPSAREAEMIAKTAVILGASDAFQFLTHSSALAAFLLLESDELVATPGSEKWLA